MSHHRGFIGFEFEKIRETGWPAIAGFLIAVAVFTWLVNLVVFPSNVLLPLIQATAGLVQSTLIVNLIGLIIIVIGIIICAGKLRRGDVGIRFSLLPQAILTTLCLWAATQLIGLVINVVSGGGLALDSVWQGRRWTRSSSGRVRTAGSTTCVSSPSCCTAGRSIRMYDCWLSRAPDRYIPKP